MNKISGHCINIDSFKTITVHQVQDRVFCYAANTAQYHVITTKSNSSL